MSRYFPLASSARASALVGVAIWSLAAFYFLLVVVTGFVSWDYPNVYVSVLVVAFGLAVNVLLLRRTASIRQLPTIGLMLVSLSLSAILVSAVVFIAIGP